MAINFHITKRRLILAVITIVSLLTNSGARADDDAMAKYRNWLPSQILKMPAEQIDEKIPTTYVISANTSDLATQSYLNTLMYNGLSDFDGAKRLFQIDLGEPPTGNLTVGQIADLEFRAKRIRLTSVSFFPFEFKASFDQNRALVSGTAKLLDEDIAYPVNHTEINCVRNEEICTYRQFALIMPDKHSFSQSYSVMETFNRIYRITRWEKDRLEASPLVTSECRIPEIRLNFSTKEFYEIVMNASEGDCETLLGGSLPKLERPRIAQIVDGEPVVRAVFQKIREENYKFLSSEFRAKAEIVYKSDQSPTRKKAE